MRHAILPAKEYLTAREIKAAFKISPQLRIHYSRTRNFPRPVNRKYPAAEVIAWARAAGWHVQVV